MRIYYSERNLLQKMNYLHRMNVIKTYFASFVQLLYPQLCASCGTHLIHEKVLCEQCVISLPYTHERAEKNYLANKLMAIERISGVYSMCYYNRGSGLEQLIKQLKYRNRKDIGHKLGIELGKQLTNYASFDYIVPVPLHKNKEKLRGYNQSYCIAKGMEEVLSIPVKQNIIVRTKNTDSQTKKTILQRTENMHQAFLITSTEIKNKRILLVDDVITTGATLLSCCKTLFEHGTKEVVLCSVAKADPY